MSSETLMTKERLIRQATDSLIESLGIMEATRFLTLKRQGRLESEERHRAWQGELDKEAFFAEVFGAEQGSKAGEE
ncbi:MAG TPA: hypothetical protein PL117_12240 [Accumulibacter sp.]|uniref:hypothetical protein n=1 Tax=Accumulibacter sp. TaxID=2053492 RepID=UPI002CBFD841|nr:hypothetical protein [Accumulibacter sp.]HRD90502.1 hypothetical protein [Accumulibacter sp.]HRF73534.1 hypothetical protein [Accumulibacter sp.]